MSDEHQGASGAPRSAIGRRQAEAIAREAHAGQRDKFEDVDYIRHVERVVALVEGDEAKTVAWLHDVVEDNPEWTFERLENEGIPRHLIRAVSMLTRRQPYTYADYIDDIATDGNPLAITVKLADLRDHLREESWDRVPAGMLKRYTLAFLKLDTALRACADALAPSTLDPMVEAQLQREIAGALKERREIYEQAPATDRSEQGRWSYRAQCNASHLADLVQRLSTLRGAPEPKGLTRDDCIALENLCAAKVREVREYAPDDAVEFSRLMQKVIAMRTPAPPRADALEASWHTAALLKDRTRRVIRERCQAGEAHAVIAADYGVPEAFVTHLAAWQLFADALDAPRTDTPERP